LFGECAESATAKLPQITYRARGLGRLGRAFWPSKDLKGGRYRNERDHEKWGLCHEEAYACSRRIGCADWFSHRR
jgi:hypothetical protein